MTGKIKQIAILGSTGSIGRQTLDVIRNFPNRFRVLGLAAGKNKELLARQVGEFKPDLVYFQGDKAKIAGMGSGFEFMPPEEMAGHPRVDTVVIATSGISGLLPLMAAARSGKKIALANKEALVAAGSIITSEVKTNRGRILPVDSEHSAIWQCLRGENKKPARLILTASGGPFLHYSREKLRDVSPDEALRHPSWQMGRKITIDSATLMNKGLEVIEAHHLFGIPFAKIEVMIHPESIVHSLVEFADGSIKAQLSYPDMRLPVQYALSYPDRLDNRHIPRLKWDQIKSLNFAPPDTVSFPCLEMAIEAGKRGETYPAVLCTADEVAVDLFISRRIKFTGIAHLVEKVLEMHRAVQSPTLNDIIECDAWARETALSLTDSNVLC